jgi:hypothetical protein
LGETTFGMEVRGVVDCLLVDDEKELLVVRQLRREVWNGKMLRHRSSSLKFAAVLRSDPLILRKW